MSLTNTPEFNYAASLPGGGTATATAQLSWTASKMEGKGKSSLSSDTVGTYSICATATQLYMNSSPQGGAAKFARLRPKANPLHLQRAKSQPASLEKLGEWIHLTHLPSRAGVAGFQTYQHLQICNQHFHLPND